MDDGLRPICTSPIPPHTSHPQGRLSLDVKTLTAQLGNPPLRSSSIQARSESIAARLKNQRPMPTQPMKNKPGIERRADTPVRIAG